MNLFEFKSESSPSIPPFQLMMAIKKIQKALIPSNTVQITQ